MPLVSSRNGLRTVYKSLTSQENFFKTFDFGTDHQVVCGRLTCFLTPFSRSFGTEITEEELSDSFSSFNGLDSVFTTVYKWLNLLDFFFS